MATTLGHVAASYADFKLEVYNENSSVGEGFPDDLILETEIPIELAGFPFLAVLLLQQQQHAKDGRQRTRMKKWSQDRRRHNASSLAEDITIYPTAFRNQSCICSHHHNRSSAHHGKAQNKRFTADPVVLKISIAGRFRFESESNKALQNDARNTTIVDIGPQIVGRFIEILSAKADSTIVAVHIDSIESVSSTNISKYVHH